jgi:hypothetical protein
LTKSAAEAAKIIIAEVNEQMPRTLGDSFIHVSKLTHIVPVDYALPEVQMGSTSEVAAQIARHIAGLIPDGATLQTGIGAIPDAVLKELIGHRDLGVHTELFADGVIDLVERGAVVRSRASSGEPSCSNRDPSSISLSALSRSSNWRSLSASVVAQPAANAARHPIPINNRAATRRPAKKISITVSFLRSMVGSRLKMITPSARNSDKPSRE